MTTRRFALALSAAATTILTLSACGGDGQAADDRKPTRAASSTPADSGRPSAAASSYKPAPPAELLPAHRTVHGMTSSPMCSHVAWDDPGYGEDLTAAGELAGAMAESIEQDFPDGRYTEVEKSADHVVKAVNTVRKLGCYDMGSTPPKTDSAKLRELCPSMSTIASLAWLNTFPHFAAWASEPGNPDRVADRAADVRLLFLRLAARLDRGPIPWPGANPEELNGNVLRQTMLETFAAPSRYPTLAKLMLAAQRGTVPPAPQAPPEAVLQNVAAVGAGVLCNDVAWPRTAASYEKDVAASRAKYPLTAGMPRNAMLCAARPYPPREAPVRITGRGPSNVLLVQNERDVNTPLAGALRMREALGRRAVMVTVDSTGHDSYLANGNACGDAAVSRFLATGQRPSADVYCR